MADQADGCIRIETALDTSGFIAGKRELEASAQKMAQNVSQLGSIAEATGKTVAQSFAASGQQIDQQTEKVQSLNGELDKLGNQKQEIKITRWNDSANSDYGGPIEKDTTVDSRYMGYSKEVADAIDGNLANTQEHVNELKQAIEETKASMKSMEKDGKWWGDEDYDKAAVKLDQLQKAAKDYKSELYSPAPNANPFGMDTLAGKIREAELELNRLSEAGKGLGDEQYDKAYQKLARLTAEAREYKKTLAASDTDAGGKSFSETLSGFGKRISDSTKKVGKFSQSLKKLKTHAVSAAKAVGNVASAAGRLLTLGHKMDNNTNSMSKALKMLMRYGLGIRSVYALVGKFRSAIVAGFSNLAQYSESTNASISSVMSSLTRLKNALATAFAPILTVVAPILSTFIDMCSRAATQVGMFFAALAGQTTFTQAKAVQQDYAESLNKTSSSTKSAAKAAEKQAKALKKAQKAAEGSIASFDELNIIQHDTADSTDSTTDTAAAGLTPKDMFEEVPIKSKIKSFADRIKNLIKKQDWKGIGKLLGSEINKGLKKVNNAIKWDNVGDKIEKGVTAITDIFNSMVDEIDWTYLGNTVGEGLNTIVRTMNLLMEKTDFKNLGKSIAEAINGLMDTTSWEEVGRFFGNRIMILWDTLNGAVHELNWASIGTSIGQALNGAFHRIDLAEIGDTLATSINGIFTSLKNFTATFDWTSFADNVRNGISTFLTETDWKANGEALGEFITKLCETLTDIMTVDNFREFGEGIGTFLSELPWGTILKTAVMTIVNAIGGLMAGLAETPAGLFVDGLVAVFGSAKIVGTLTAAFKTLFGTAASNGADGAISALRAAGVFAKFASAIGIGVAAGTKASEASTSTEDELKSTQELLANFSLVLDDLKEKGIVSGAAMDTLQKNISAISSDGSPAGTISALRDALVDANVSADDLAKSITDTDTDLTELYNVMANSTGVIDSTTGKTRSFATAIAGVETSPLIDKLESLKGTISKVEFADMVVKSANAIDEMGGIWENGKQILGEKALAIHAEISAGLSPDENGFYKLASGQMVQYGQAIEDSGGTLKEKTKSTMDAGLKAGIEECLPEQNQIGGEMGNYFIEGYTSALLGNKQIKSAYEEALKGVDTTVAQEQAKSTGEELGKNTGTGFQKGIDEVSGDVSDSVTNMMEKSVKEPAQKAVDSHSPSKWFAQLATYCGQGFGNNLNNAFSSTFTWFGNFRTRIENSIGSLYNTGYNFLIGMNNGMVAGASVMYNNARNIASTITGIFRSAWKIHSPSRVSGEIMDYYMQGFYNHMQTGADKLLNAFSSFADLVKDVKFEAPKLDIPVTYSPTTSASYLNQVPLMAQGKVIPPNTVRDYSNDKSRESDIANSIEKVLKTMKNDDSNVGNSNPQYITLEIDGREIVRWMQKQNEQNLNRGGSGLFPSAL